MPGKRIITYLTVISFCLYYVGSGGVSKTEAKKLEPEKKYIVCTKAAGELEKMEEMYDKTEDINRNGENCLNDNHMISLQLTEDEADELAEESQIEFVEEDVCVRASINNEDEEIDRAGWHKKECTRIKKNQAEDEWNIRMINGDKVPQNRKMKKRVKIAILDSGIDYGNDIQLAETVTLVPGEDGMSPLFMDGTGHGNSVAGLIAAEDNDEGITGIAPNSEIYSYRVLDDDNCAPISRVVEAIYMAIDREVNIINMSFGVDVYSKALAQAVKDAEDAGILIIAAAGNTGKKGVQYPAALDEVMAVGSVDKNGDVAESSSVGKEIEIVAPGELVRSTGVLGDQLVSSGTSLAAPQVAGVAALIWEQDLNASADFVRALLNESANAYGNEEEYGNGLVDAKYAMEHYKEFKKSYKKNKNAKLKENTAKVLSFEDTGCVKGSWSKDDHEYAVPSQNRNVQKGARFPDTEHYKEIDFSSENKKYIYSGMTNNPWWHGHQSGNYVSAYIYETRLANQMKYPGYVAVPNGLTDSAKRGIDADLAHLKQHWSDKEVLNNASPTDGTKRAFIWGMAIHNLTDAFAHSAYAFDSTDKKWVHLVHNVKNAYHNNPVYACADDTTKFAERWQDARRAVYAAMCQYDKSAHPSGTYKEFRYVQDSSKYRLGNIYGYVAAVAGTTAASGFLNSSCSTK